MDKEKLIHDVLQCAYNVHLILTPGYVEKVYQKALMVELAMAGIYARQAVPINVYYKGNLVGEYEADIVVENCLILELKAVYNIVVAHEVQLVNYLTATGINDGLVINFGSDKFETSRKFREYKPRI